MNPYFSLISVFVKGSTEEIEAVPINNDVETLTFGLPKTRGKKTAKS